jgi:hypothetical protein
LRDPTGFGAEVIPGAEDRLVAELKAVNKELRALGKKTQPINVELDGKKVMKVLTMRAEDDDESSLGENIEDTPWS